MRCDFVQALVFIFLYIHLIQHSRVVYVQKFCALLCDLLDFALA